MTKCLLMLGVIGVGALALGGCTTGTSSAPGAGTEAVTIPEAQELARTASIATDAMYAADAIVAVPQTAEAAARQGGSPGGEALRLKDGTSCTQDGDGWQLQRPDGTAIGISGDGSRQIHRHGHRTMAQVVAGEGGAVEVTDPQRRRLRVEQNGDGLGFMMQHRNAAGELAGERVSVVPQDDGSLEVHLASGTIIVIREEAGVFAVTTQNGNALCEAEISQDGDSITVTMPSGKLLTVVRNEDLSLTVTLPNGTTTTVPAPELGG